MDAFGIAITAVLFGFLLLAPIIGNPSLLEMSAETESTFHGCSRMAGELL